jgi:hypothetical protein
MSTARSAGSRVVSKPGTGASLGPDQEVDLAAAEEDRLGAAVDEVAHDPPVRIA